MAPASAGGHSDSPSQAPAWENTPDSRLSGKDDSGRLCGNGGRGPPARETAAPEPSYMVMACMTPERLPSVSLQ